MNIRSTLLLPVITLTASTGFAHDIVVAPGASPGNGGRPDNKGIAPGCVFKDNVRVKGDEWPEAARKIMDNAGLEPAYRDLLEAGDDRPAGSSVKKAR